MQLRRRIGYVIQQIGLFPHQKIVTNVATVPSLLGTPKAQAHERALELLDLVGLDPETFADRYPHQLSGGQQQRVGVARALAADPPVLLMDEPFAAVDPIVRARLQDEFLRLQAELGKTVVLVTHDIDEAVKMGDQVAVFAAGRPPRAVRRPRPSCSATRPTTSWPTSSGRPPASAGSTVTKLDPAHLEPLDGVATGDLAAAIDLDSTLEHALAVLLRDDKADDRGEGRCAVRRRPHPRRHPPRPPRRLAESGNEGAARERRLSKPHG